MIWGQSIPHKVFLVHILYVVKQNMDILPCAIPQGEQMSTFQERIRYVRGNLSRDDFAESIGVHKNTVGRYERGESEPELTIISKICAKYNVEPKWLISGEGIAPNVDDEQMVPFYTEDGHRAYGIRKRGEKDDITTHQNISYLTEIIENLIDDSAINLDKSYANALANLYYTEMKSRLDYFAHEIEKLVSSKP